VVSTGKSGWGLEVVRGREVGRVYPLGPGRSLLGNGLNGEPGIDLEAGQWLAERGVAAIGADNFAIEAIPFPEGQVFPVHQCVLRGYGVALIEGLVLEQLAKSGASEFLFIASPLPIVGGTGSPLSPVAVL